MFERIKCKIVEIFYCMYAKVNSNWNKFDKKVLYYCIYCSFFNPHITLNNVAKNYNELFCLLYVLYYKNHFIPFLMVLFSNMQSLKSIRKWFCSIIIEIVADDTNSYDGKHFNCGFGSWLKIQRKTNYELCPNYLAKVPLFILISGM